MLKEICIDAAVNSSVLNCGEGRSIRFDLISSEVNGESFHLGESKLDLIGVFQSHCPDSLFLRHRLSKALNMSCSSYLNIITY